MARRNLAPAQLAVVQAVRAVRDACTDPVLVGV